jgi:anti-anti-sigma factor
MALEVHAYEEGAQCVLKLHGEVTIYMTDELNMVIDRLIEGGCRELVVDIEDVSFVDSSCLGVLLGTFRRLDADGGWVRVVCPQGEVLRVLRTVGFDRWLEVFETVEQARCAPSGR